MSEASRNLPGNSLPADEGSASIAQVREACPRDAASKTSTKENPSLPEHLL